MYKRIIRLFSVSLFIIILGCGMQGSDTGNLPQQEDQKGVRTLQRVLAESRIQISINTKSEERYLLEIKEDLISSQSVTITVDVPSFMTYDVTSDIVFHVNDLDVIEAEGGIYIDVVYNELIDPDIKRVFVQARIEDGNGLIGEEVPENIIPLEIMGMDIMSYTGIDSNNQILKEWLPPYHNAINENHTLYLRADFTNALPQQFTGTIIIEFLEEVNYTLTLWNKLGSDDEVINSEVGPQLTLSTDVNRSYGEGYFGNAIMPTTKNIAGTIIHNIILNDTSQCLDTEKGTIEFWYNEIEPPVPYQNGVYRLFDGPWGFSPGVEIYSYKNPNDPNDYGLYLCVGFGNSCIYTYSVENPDKKGVDISAYTNTFIHIAAVWDRNGIDGSDEYIRLYINNEKKAVSYENDWGITIGDQTDIAGGQDNIDSKFYLDNLKIYKRAKTDFSDRFIE